MSGSGRGAGFFVHTITKPAAWRGGLQVVEELEEDPEHMKKCEEKEKEWAKHCQCGSVAQGMEDKLWGSEEVRSCNEVWSLQEWREDKSPAFRQQIG